MTAAPLAPADHGKLSMIRPEVTYYDHQVEGIRTLCRMGSALLADDMGLGKSIQSLTVFAVDYEVGTAKRCVIVAPASLKWNWAEEIERFTLFTAVVLDGTPKQREKQLDDFDADILIVNYEQVIGHVDQINALGFQVAIYDEAHMIKGPKSKRTKAAQKINADRHLLLTGSPLLNHVNDLWSLMYRIAPGEFPNYYKFLHRYALFGGFKDKEIVGIKNEGELRERVDVRMVRRRKADVLDLPDKQIIQVSVDLHPEQRKLYKQAVEEMIIDLPGNPEPMELENALTRMLRLKQICGTTATIEGYADHSIKLDVGVEKVTEVIENGRPVVVFTQFRDVQACFVQRLTAAGIDSRVLNGDVPMRERVPTVTAWGEDAERGLPQALVCMLQVAGVGLNMTQANTAVFLDKLWVPKLNDQAQDRLHRIGADKSQPVQIIELIARGTVEQRVEQIISRKAKVFNTLIETSDWKRKLYDALKEGM